MPTRPPQKVAPNEGAEGRRQRRLLKLCVKSVATLFVGCLALIVAGALALQFPAVQKRVKSAVVDAVERRTGLRLELGSLSGSLFTDLRLTDLRLTDPSGPLLAVDQVSIDYTLPLLLKRMLVIRGLHLEKPQVFLSRKTDGTWNLEDAARRFASPDRAPPSGSPFRVFVDRLTIDDGALTIRDAGSGSERIRRIENFRIEVGLDIDAEVKADLRQLAFSLDDPPFVVRGLEGRLRYDQARRDLYIEGVTLQTKGSTATADGRLSLRQPDPYINLTTSIETLSITELGRLLGTDALAQGEISGEIDLQGTPQWLHHRLKLVLDRQQSLVAEGVLALEGEQGLTVAASGSLHHIDPAGWPLVDAPQLKGDVDADFTLDGNDLDGAGRQVRLTLRTAASRLAGHQIDRGYFDLTLENGGLTIAAASLVGPAGGVRVQGRLGGIESDPPFKTVSISGEVRGLDPAAFLADPLWAGKLTAGFRAAAEQAPEGLAGWQPRDWLAQAEITLQPSTLFGNRVRQADMKARWGGAVVRVTSFELDSDLTRASLEGRAVAGDRSYRIGGRIALPDLHRLKPLLAKVAPGFPLERIPAGHVEITGQVEGRPQKTGIDVQVKGDGLSLEAVTVASLELDGNWHITPAAVRGRTSGRVSDIDYQGHRFPRLDLTADLDPDRLGVDLSLTHSAGERLKLEGTVDQWQQPERRVRIDTLQVSGLGAPLDALIPEMRNTAPIRLRTDPRGVDIESLALSSGTASLQAEGRLAREGPQRFRLLIEGLALERLETLWQEQPTLKGQVTAEAKLGGTARSPVVAAEVKVRGASGYDVSLSHLNLQVDFREETVRLTASGFKGERKLFDVDGRSGLVFRLMPFEFRPQAGSLQAQLVAEDLRLSELPLPAQGEVKLDGRMRVRLQAAGDLGRPQLTGFLSLKDGALALPRHGLSYESLQADLRLHPGILTIERLLVSGDQEGQLSLTGQVFLTGWSPGELDLHLTGKRAAVAWKREFTARIEPDLFLTGPLSSPAVSGLIRIPEGRIHLDRLAAGGPAEIEVLGEQSAEGQPIVIGERREDPLSPLSADVRIEIPRNVWLRGQSLTAEIAGSIRLQKEKQAPFRLTGSLNTVRGDYEFQNRRFKITRGVVEFQGLPEPDPRLDIEAETRIRNVTIIVRINGSVRRIDLSLDSDPAMEQSDIISYLVFGRPTGELRSQQATSAEAAALSLAGNVAARELNAILGDTFKVDTFAIDPGDDGWGSGSLAVGKYVARNIFVTYRYEFSAQNFGEVEIEYELTRNFSIAAQVGNDRTSGVDLIWKFDF